MIERRESGAVHPLGEGPIDLAHLARQTLHDPELKREILELFVAQLLSARDQLQDTDAEARRRLAHCLVGSARAVGAFALADCAAELEASPKSAPLAERLSALIDEVRLFAAGLAG